eukprot:17313-Amphidinium_carterae.1
MTQHDIDIGQRFMTKVLIERRALQRPLDLATSRAKSARADDPASHIEVVDVDSALEMAHFAPPEQMPDSSIPNHLEVIVLDDDDDPHHPDARRVKRKKWNLAEQRPELPAHLRLEDTPFRQQF